MIGTDYASVADGQLDPLWREHGRHTAGRGYIGAENDPLGGNFRVQRHTVHGGDVLYGGTRCEVMSPAIHANDGERTQAGFSLALPADFVSDGGWWNSLMDYHYPNDGLDQSPVGLNIINSGELVVRVLGGPVTPDGTRGSIRSQGKVADLTKGVYHTICWDLLMDPVDGLLDIYVDGVRAWSHRGPTNSRGKPNNTYLKQGFYRPSGNTITATYLFRDTKAWYNQSPAAMLAHFGGAALPPPPPRVPTNAELRDQADIALRATTTTYATWKKKLDQGAYADPTKTQWWKAFDALGKIK